MAKENGTRGKDDRGRIKGQKKRQISVWRGMGTGEVFRMKNNFKYIMSN